MKKSVLKFVSVTAALILAVGAMAGCGSTDTADKLVMGTNAAFEPFEFTTTDGLVGEFDGIDVAIAVELAKAMNKELVIEDMEFEGLLASVQGGKIDMAVAGMTIKPERLESVDFSIPYYTATQVMVVAADNADITCADDLKNGKLDAVVIDSYTGKVLAEKNGLKVIEDAEAFEAEEYAIAVKKGNTELLDAINTKLDEMLTSGQIAEIAAQYN